MGGFFVVVVDVVNNIGRVLLELLLFGNQDERWRIVLGFLDKSLMILWGLVAGPEVIPAGWVAAFAQEIKDWLVGEAEN